MAKTGKSGPAYDPFNAGNQAFPDLDKALGDLDEEPQTPAKVPAAGNDQDKRAEERPSAPPAKKKAPQRRSETKKKKAASGGGGEEPRGRRPDPAKTTKRFLTTREEASRFETAAMRLGAELGISVDFSKLTRALWECYLKHETDIVRNVPQGEEWRRPSNSDGVGLAELDEQLTELVNEGLLMAGRRLRQPKG